MECRKCGHEIEEGHKMCLNCGSAVDFEEITDQEKHEEQIEQIIKQKPIHKLSRQMIGGVLMFIIACLCVGFAMSYTSKTLSMFSTTPTKAPSSTLTTVSTQPTSATAAEPIINEYEAEYRQFPLRIIGFYAEKKNGIMPKLYVNVQNTSEDYILNEFTVRVIAFDETGKRISKNNTEAGKYIDFKFKGQQLAPGESLKSLEMIPVGFEKGANFRIAIMSAQSADGYQYDQSESSLIWKKADVTEE